MATQLPSSIYKDTLIQGLLKSDTIVRALSHSRPDFQLLNLPDNPSNLIHDSIFPYKHVPGIQEDAKTYITMAVNFKWDAKSKNVLRDVDIVIYVFTHQSLQRTEYGSIRTDMIASEIDALMNDRNGFGIAKIYLADLYEYQIAESEYNGVIMKYSTKGLSVQRFFNR